MKVKELEERACAYDGCNKRFKPKTYNQRFCCTGHRELQKSIERRKTVGDKGHFLERLDQDELRKLRKKKTFYEVIGDRVVAAVERLPAPPHPDVAEIVVGKRQDEEEMVLLFSDLHLGLKTRAEETGGLGEYSFETFARRMDFFKKSLKRNFEIHFTNTPYKVINIFSLGDLIESQILRASQLRATDLRVVDQVIRAVDQISYFIQWLASIFPRVNFYGVPGNHSRMTQEIGYLSPQDTFEYLIMVWLKERLANCKNVSINFSDSWWMMVERQGWKFYLEHGEEFHSWLGIPFYALQRGKMNIRELMRQYLSEQGRNVDPDYFVIGHHHTSANFQGVLMNGSWVGGTEYSLKRLKKGDSSSQKLFSIHKHFGVTWSRDILLDDSRCKPRIKVYK